jgi:DNA ligase 1
MSNICAAKLTLAHTYTEKRVEYPCRLSRKLDGIRATYREGNFFSRDNKKWNEPVIAHLLKPLRKALGNKIQLDGEFYKHGWKLQQINSAIAVKRLAPTEDSPLIEYHVFDIVLPDTPLRERRALLKEQVRLYVNHPMIKVVPHYFADSYMRALSLYTKFVAEGYEGAMFRLDDEGYEPCRSYRLLKWKDFKDDEFEIVDILEGKVTDKGGKHVGRMGALVCKTKSGKTFHVGTGYDDAERDAMWKNPPIGEMLSVRFLGLSKEGVPLIPSAKGIRNYE